MPTALWQLPSGNCPLPNKRARTHHPPPLPTTNSQQSTVNNQLPSAPEN
ncbi:hypothetical protein IQ252_17695 [Tychonema sp. LEGE 07203]|nr:hypothetical protein [Tychonema sp. LEGE 07203]